MTHVIVSGLPDIPKLNKLVFNFKGLLQRRGIEKFWVKEMARMPNSDLNYAKVEFYSFKDATFATESLNGHKYVAGKSYPLTARLEESTNRRYVQRSPVPRRRTPSPYRRPREPYDRRAEPAARDYRPRERSRERNPYDLEATKLDLEIELLKKKRLIIEEERRLLEERKKLELVQAFGPSALDDFDGGRDRRRRPRRSPEPFNPRRPRSRSPIRSRRPSPRPRPVRPTRLEPRPKELDRRFNSTATIPQFLAPCKIILREMSDTLSKHAEPKEMENLRKLLRGTLRNRLATVLDKKPLMKLAEVCRCYREKYPVSTDDELVSKQVKNLRACHLPHNKKADKKPATESKPKTEGSNKTGDAKANDEEGESSQVKDETNNADDTATAHSEINNIKAEQPNDVEMETEPKTETEVNVDKKEETPKVEENANGVQKIEKAEEIAEKNRKTVTKTEANADGVQKIEKAEENADKNQKTVTPGKVQKTVTKPNANTVQVQKTITKPNANVVQVQKTVTKPNANAVQVQKTVTKPNANADKVQKTVTKTKTLVSASKKNAKAEINSEESKEGENDESEPMVDDWTTGGEDWIELNTEESEDGEKVMEE